MSVDGTSPGRRSGSKPASREGSTEEGGGKASGARLMSASGPRSVTEKPALRVRPASSLGIQNKSSILNISRTSSTDSWEGKGSGGASMFLFDGKPAPVTPLE